jgi:hypothetical protein
LSKIHEFVQNGATTLSITTLSMASGAECCVFIAIPSVVMPTALSKMTLSMSPSAEGNFSYRYAELFYCDSECNYANDTWHNATKYGVFMMNAVMLNAAMLNAAMLNAAMLNVAMLNAAMLNAAMLNAAMLNAAMLNAAMLNAVLLNVAMLNAAMLSC